jgi:hypothetical protein
MDDFQDDPTLQAMKRLFTPDVDRARAARIRERCHRAYRRRGWTRRPAVLEPVLVVGACAVYLSEVVTRALRLLW